MTAVVNGLELHFDVHGAGEPLLWLHGMLGVGDDWRFAFGEPPAGYRLIAPDMRGHGQTTGDADTCSFAQWARDAFALLDRLHVDRVNIVGISGGGICALHMATMQPDRVGAMVVVSAPARFPEKACAMQRVFTEAILGDVERRRIRDVHRRDGQVERLIGQIRRLPDGGDPAFDAAQLARITADTLIVWGDRDPLYPVASALELRDAIPRSWLWVVPNGKHCPVFGREAPRFADTALEFFGGRFRPGPAETGPFG